jgi:hypothetical protein
MPTAIRFITRIQDADDFADLDAVQFVSMAASAFVANERVLTGTANQVIVTDGGAGGAVTLSTPQDIHTGAAPQFAGLGIGVAGVVGQLLIPIGNVGAPGLAFSDDTDTGIYRLAVGDRIYMTAGAVNVCTFSPTWVTIYGPLYGAAGAAGAPSYSFSGDTDTGMWHPGADIVAISTGGTERVRIDSLVTVSNTQTLLVNIADGYSAGLRLDPGYTAAFTVTRHNYIDVQDVSVAAGAAVTNAAVMRFDAAIGTHKALPAAFQTTDSNGDTTNWAGGLIINVLGTLYKIPFVAV